MESYLRSGAEGLFFLFSWFCLFSAGSVTEQYNPSGQGPEGSYNPLIRFQSWTSESDQCEHWSPDFSFQISRFCVACIITTTTTTIISNNNNNNLYLHPFVLKGGRLMVSNYLRYSLRSWLKVLFHHRVGRRLKLLRTEKLSFHINTKTLKRSMKHSQRVPLKARKQRTPADNQWSGRQRPSLDFQL